MLNVKSKKLILKRKWPKVLLFFLACALLVSLLIYKFLDRLPERNMARDFLLSNQKIQAEFGKPVSVEYSGSGSSVSFKRSKREGKYTFSVKGSKKAGTVRVHWQSTGPGIGFTVNSIELLEPWEDPELIWSPE